MLDRLFKILLVFVPLTICAEFFHFPPVSIFCLAALAIVPLARTIGQATEELATTTGPAIGGLLNATFGNITELLIGFFAIKAGLVEVVKASITGSIIGNLLLVTGLAIVAGGARYPKLTFNRTAALAAGSTLFLAAIGLIVPALFLQTVPAVGSQIIGKLSVFVSVCLIVVYVASLFFSLRTHAHLYTEEVGRFEPSRSRRTSLVILGVSTLVVALMSEILVSTVKPVAAHLGWSQLFIGVILIAIIGNAAEHTSAILTATKKRMDLSLQISIGSATQIAMFVAPVLVLVSLFFQKPMSLVFTTFELIAILLSIVITNLVISDGETNWLEGVQLLVAYAILGVAFFFHP